MTDTETTPAQRVRAWLAASAPFVDSRYPDIIRGVASGARWYGLTRTDVAWILNRLDSMTLEAHAREGRIRDLGEDVAKLRALEMHGVDNWEGYSDAMASLEDSE